MKYSVPFLIAAAVFTTAHAHIVPFTSASAPTPMVQIAGPLDLNTQINDWLVFSSDEHAVWCDGDCLAPYNAAGYYGVRFQTDDGAHFGWTRIGTSGSGTIGVVQGAYEDQAGRSIPAGAVDAVPPDGCGTADFNCDGDIGTDSDISGFFACLSGSCPPAPCTNSADFNGDGDLGTDADIEVFFRVLSGGHC